MLAATRESLHTAMETPCSQSQFININGCKHIQTKVMKTRSLTLHINLRESSNEGFTYR